MTAYQLVKLAPWCGLVLAGVLLLWLLLVSFRAYGRRKFVAEEVPEVVREWLPVAERDTNVIGHLGTGVARTAPEHRRRPPKGFRAASLRSTTTHRGGSTEYDDLTVDVAIASHAVKRQVAALLRIGEHEA